MERIIKFRAWDVAKKEMIYHGVFQFEQFPKHPLGPQDIRQRIFPFDGIESGEMITKDVLNGWYMMQFIGHKDVFESDICKFTYSKDHHVYHGIGEVFYSEHEAAWCISSKDGRMLLSSVNHLSIIGNKFENPELLNS